MTYADKATFGGFCTQPPLPMRATFGVLDQTLTAKFRIDRFILSFCGGEKL